MKVVGYWHETIKNYRYDKDVSASRMLVPTRPRVGKWQKNIFWCGMLPNIILNKGFIMAWILIYKWFKTIVYHLIYRHQYSGIPINNHVFENNNARECYPYKIIQRIMLILPWINYKSWAPRCQTKQLNRTSTALHHFRPQSKQESEPWI